MQSRCRDDGGWGIRKEAGKTSDTRWVSGTFRDKISKRANKRISEILFYRAKDEGRVNA